MLKPYLKYSTLLPCYKSENLLKKVVGKDRMISQLFDDKKEELILYDNGGNGNVLDFFKNKRRVKVIGDGQNIGLNAALNKCAEVAEGHHFFLPHTDMLPDTYFSDSLLKEADKHAPGTYLFCCRSIERTQGHTPFHIIEDLGDADTLNLNKVRSRAWKHLNESKGQIVTGYRMPFFMHRKLWERMGGVDENYFSYATDDDLFMTAYDVGVRKFWMMKDSLVYHLQGQSNAQQNVDRDSDAPYAYFRKKWKAKGYNTDQPIDHLMQSLIPWNIRVK